MAFTHTSVVIFRVESSTSGFGLVLRVTSSAKGRGHAGRGGGGDAPPHGGSRRQRRGLLFVGRGMGRAEGQGHDAKVLGHAKGRGKSARAAAAGARPRPEHSRAGASLGGSWLGVVRRRST